MDEYRQLKSTLGLMDFSDQIALAARLAEHPVVGALEREKYGVVLLDEYQDTSVAQALMLRRLFGRAATGHRGRRPQPGDLRLARRLGLQHPAFRRRLPAGRWWRVRSFPLTVNRRSDRRILDVANRLAAPLYAAFSQVRAAGGRRPTMRASADRRTLDL